MRRTNQAPKPFTIIRVADAFDPETSILWETQTPVLERISAAGRRGLAAEALRPFYAESAALYPELYEGTEFQAWLQFLEGVELIAWREERATVTASGIEFLKCRVAATAAV